MKIFVVHYPGTAGVVDSLRSIACGIKESDQVYYVLEFGDDLEKDFVKSVSKRWGWKVIGLRTFLRTVGALGDEKILILSDMYCPSKNWRSELESFLERDPDLLSSIVTVPTRDNEKGSKEAYEVSVGSVHLLMLSADLVRECEPSHLATLAVEVCLVSRLKGVRTFAVPMKYKVLRKVDIPFDKKWNVLSKWFKSRRSSRIVAVVDADKYDEQLNDLVDDVVTPSIVGVPSGMRGLDLWELMYAKAVRDCGAEWVLFLRGCERLGGELSKDTLRDLVKSALLSVFSYRFKVVGLSGGYVRLDGKWGSSCERRLFRAVPNLDFRGPSSLTGVPEPAFPEGLNFAAPVCVEHPVDVGNEGVVKLAKYRGFPSIGLVVITRDEAQDLASLLESCYTYFSERIVVVDSRTSDNTREIARSFGCYVYDFDWVDDFSAMRNFGVERCSCEYVMQLDTDERVPGLEVIYGMVLTGADAYLFPVANHHPDGKVSYSDSYRLFRNDGLRYSGRVHETIEESLSGSERRTEVAPIMIHHFGYMKPPQRVDSKLELYKKLNAMKAAEDPFDPRPYFDIALEKINEGKTKEAIELLEKSKELSKQMYLPRKELGLVYLRLALENLREAVQCMPARHPMKRNLAEFTKRVAEVTEPPVFVGSKARGDESC